MTEAATQLKNHLVICGWQPEIATLIREILEANPDWSSRDIVLIAHIEPDAVAELRGESGLEHLQVVCADPFHESALKQASVETAAKVLVLADESNPAMSPTESDAQTIMTVMTVERLAPHVYKIAEMLHSDLSSYLKIADVDEVIFPQEYSRFLLAGITTSMGLAHVVYDLLSVHTPCVLTSIPVPDEFIGRTFGDLFRHFDELPGDRRICIGLLENTGNLHSLRRHAKIDAQKAGGYGSVIQNLKKVKEISPNLPQLNPGDDYIIKRHSMAVVVMTHENTKTQSTAADGTARS